MPEPDSKIFCRSRPPEPPRERGLTAPVTATYFNRAWSLAYFRTY